MTHNVSTLSDCESTSEVHEEIVAYLRGTISSLLEENQILKEKNGKLEETVQNLTVANQIIEENKNKSEEKMKQLIQKIKNMEILKSQLKKFNKMDRQVGILEKTQKILKLKSKDDEVFTDKLRNAVIRMTEERIELKKEFKDELFALKQDNKKWKDNFVKIATKREIFDKEEVLQMKNDYKESLKRSKKSRSFSSAQREQMISDLFCKSEEISTSV